MALIEIRRDPSRKELLWFGALLPLVLVLVGAIVWWRWQSSTAAAWVWAIAAVVAAAFWAVPALRLRIYLVWVMATFPIGWLVAHTILALVYLLVVTPIGLVVRATGRVTVRAPFDRRAASYWVARQRDPRPRRYFRQF